MPAALWKNPFVVLQLSCNYGRLCCPFSKHSLQRAGASTDSEPAGHEPKREILNKNDFNSSDSPFFHGRSSVQCFRPEFQYPWACSLPHVPCDVRQIIQTSCRSRLVTYRQSELICGQVLVRTTSAVIDIRNPLSNRFQGLFLGTMIVCYDNRYD
jgi:hypothetical protein